jgi:hypothetical protein
MAIDDGADVAGVASTAVPHAMTVRQPESDAGFDAGPDIEPQG